MKSIATALITATIVLVCALGAMASDYTKGVVKKIDAKSGKVTVIHEELKSLDMPAMTMVFRAADEAMLARLKVGDAIEFVADRVNGKLTITELK